MVFSENDRQCTGWFGQAHGKAKKYSRVVRRTVHTATKKSNEIAAPHAKSFADGSSKAIHECSLMLKRTGSSIAKTSNEVKPKLETMGEKAGKQIKKSTRAINTIMSSAIGESQEVLKSQAYKLSTSSSLDTILRKSCSLDTLEIIEKIIPGVANPSRETPKISSDTIWNDLSLFDGALIKEADVIRRQNNSMDTRNEVEVKAEVEQKSERMNVCVFVEKRYDVPSQWIELCLVPENLQVLDDVVNHSTVTPITSNISCV